MPFAVDDLELIKAYIEERPNIEIFFTVKGSKVKILAGKLAWKGEIKDPDALDRLIQFLTEHGGYLIHDVVDLEGALT